MKKLLMILISLIITNYAIAMVCECPYCSKDQSVDLISRNTKGRRQQIQSRLIKHGVDISKNGCGYLCVITTLYKKNIIKTTAELNETVDKLFEMELKYCQLAGCPEYIYDGTMLQDVIYDAIRDAGFIRTENINFENLSIRGYSSLKEYIHSEIEQSPKAFFIIHSDSHVEPFIPRSRVFTRRVNRVKDKFDHNAISQIEVWDNITRL